MDKSAWTWLCRCCYLEKEIGYALSELERGGDWPRHARERLEGLFRRGAHDPDPAEQLLRAVLEALCERDGLGLGSAADPGTPARNYELALRLGIGRVFGLTEEGGQG